MTKRLEKHTRKEIIVRCSSLVMFSTSAIYRRLDVLDKERVDCSGEESSISRC